MALYSPDPAPIFLLLLIMGYAAYAGSVEMCPECYLQHCLNCKLVSSACTQTVGVIVLWEACQSNCLKEAVCNSGEYRPGVMGCYRFTCSQVEEDVSGAGYHSFRKTCQLSDCLTYNITTQADHIGICPTLETHADVASLSYCLMLCLDLDKCRGATYLPNRTCLLHECESATGDSNGANFIARNCFDDATQMQGLSTATPSVTKKASACARMTFANETATTVATTMAVTEKTLMPSTSFSSVRKIKTTFDTKTTTIVPVFTISVNDQQSTTNIKMQTLSSNSTHVQPILTSTTATVTTLIDTQCECNDRNDYLDDPINTAIIASAGGIVTVTMVGTGIYTKYLKRGRIS